MFLMVVLTHAALYSTMNSKPSALINFTVSLAICSDLSDKDLFPGGKLAQGEEWCCRWQHCTLSVITGFLEEK